MKELLLFTILVAICSSIFCKTLDEYPGVYQLTEPVEHAECPFWDDRNNILYYVNIPQGQILRYDYETNDLKSIALDGEIAPVIPSEKDPNLLIAGLDRSVVAVEWDGVSEPSETRILTSFSEQFPTSKVNDGKADVKGRLWIGTMGGYQDSEGVAPNEGVLYKVTCENLKSPETEIAPVNVSNGAAFNAANNKFFYIDTPTGQVAVYDFDSEKGEISNKNVAFDMKNYNDRITGGPDGMTIDADENLWIALYGGGAVIKVNPSTGELLKVVPIPARDVTSTMWGGPDLDILYVTTSRIGLSDEEKLQQPMAGAVFAVKGLGAKGTPMAKVDLLTTIDDKDCGASKRSPSKN